MTQPDPPLQPLVPEPEKGGRFRANVLVQHLLLVAKRQGVDMNSLAGVPASDADRQQFAMLIGYSVSGFLELSYVDDVLADRVIRAATEQGLIDPDKRWWWQG